MFVVVAEPVDVTESSVKFRMMDADTNFKFKDPGFKLCLYLALFTLST